MSQPTAAMRRPRRGFTIIEVVLTLIVLAVLVVVALPSFQNQIRKGRRSEAVAALAALQQAQERWRSSNVAYADNGQLTTGLKQKSTTSSGYYAIAITEAGAARYVATATAVSGSSQASDADCTVLAVRMDQGNLSYGAGSSIDWADPKRCWAR